MYGNQQSPGPDYSQSTPWAVPGGTAGDVAMQRSAAADQQQRDIHQRNVRGAETAFEGAGIIVLFEVIIGRLIRRFRR